MVAQTWLDPALARKQAKVIAERLAIVYPQAAESIGARAAKLDERLLELQRQVEKVAGEVQRGQMVVTATPEVKFFTRALGIEDRHQNWIEFPPAPEVAKELETLKELNADEPTKPRWLLVTQPPSPEIRSAIESAEFQIIEFETLGQPPRSGDYFDTMLRNLDRMTSVLQHRTARP
jgi:ABC-type Zn uptake system ZnuABC Zn-binding protein ZnuA